MSGNSALTTALPINPKFENISPYVYMFCVYLSFAKHFEIRIAAGIITARIIPLTRRSFQADEIRSTVKFSIKVERISPGTNTMFSSFASTSEEASGIILHFARM